MDTTDVDPLLTDKEVGRILGGLSRPTVWRYVAKGTIPKPIKLGPGTARWPQSEIIGVIEAAKAAREPVAA